MNPKARNEALLHYQISLPRSLALSLTLLCLSGCGFVLAPLETATVGALRTVVKEYDKQLNKEELLETQVQDDRPIIKAAEKNEQAQLLLPKPLLHPTPGHPSKNMENQITRLSLMPADAMR